MATSNTGDYRRILAERQHFFLLHGSWAISAIAQLTVPERVTFPEPPELLPIRT